MDASKRARKAEAAPRSSSDTDSDPQAVVFSASPTSLGKRAQDDALASADAKKQRKTKTKSSPKAKDQTESEVASESKDQAAELSGAEQAAAASAAVLTDAAQPVEMVITTEEAAGLSAAVTEQVPVPPKPRKGRRVRKTNLEKMEILAFVDQGGSQGAAAEKFGVSRTAVTKMVKERAAISAQALVESATSSRKVLQYQHKLSVIEDMLYKWQMQVELDAPALKVTGELLQSKAMEFRNKILADYSTASKSIQQQGQAIPEQGSPVIDAFDVHAHTHMRNTLGWLHMAWESVPASSIRQAWAASLYLSAREPGDGEAAAAIIEEEGIKAYTELLSRLTKVPALQKTLGLDFTETPGQFMLELQDFDKSEINGADELVKDNEIVVESLAAQGLLRDTQRALVLESIKTDDLPVLSASEATSTVSRLLHFMSRENDNLLTLSERRTGRANLLILQRLLLKAREREREREATTDFTV
ncbi:hypothetical protein PHYPSEUDO_011814 [Phytophthora pseudosyringae]|uniref:HTH psq-type domain-containing protein n=1 Tax=Phytophthora pseudosyringae TaxID=221518 RepID=A0A8T1W607_9STRA|nr:hypothetical protein PHYPSEUDO_011814 [Phytophthora pseudosyringae]